MRHKLEIFSLGSPRILLDEQDITSQFETNAARALLIYLTLNREQIHSRITLANLIWPDAAPDRALKTFSQTLNRVRNALSDRDVENPMILTLGHKNIQLNTEHHYWTDITEFSQQVEASQDHRHRQLQNCPICLERLEQAAHLYQADFLSGFELNSELYQSWVAGLGNEVHRQALEIFHNLADYYARQGLYDYTLLYAQRQLLFEPWNEEAHCQLMRAYALAGKQSNALAQYRECCQILLDEFSLAPASSTDRLYDEIRNDSLQTTQASRQEFNNLPRTLTRFIGRAKELTYLVDLLIDPTNRLVTVTGLGGVGKTRLAVAAAEKVINSFTHGVLFVDAYTLSHDLANCTVDQTVDQLALSIAQLLNKETDFWQEFSASLANLSPASALLDYFKTKELLLILDDAEQFPAFSKLIWQLMTETEGIVCLVTSRQPLSIHGEKVMPLYGFTYPNTPISDDDTAHAPATLLAEYESVQFLVERATAYNAKFVLDKQNVLAIVEICQAVAGLPLALEMAASQIGLDEANQRLDEITCQIQKGLASLQICVIGIAQRHQSLLAILSDAWDRLTDPESSLLLELIRCWPDNVTLQDIQQSTRFKRLIDYTLVTRDTLGNYEISPLVRQFVVQNPALCHS